MGYLKNKPGSLEAASATAIGMPEARTPAQQQTHDKMMKDFLAKGGKIQNMLRARGPAFVGGGGNNSSNVGCCSATVL